MTFFVATRMIEIDKMLDIQVCSLLILLLKSIRYRIFAFLLRQNERLMDEAFAKSFATICTIFNSAQCDEYIHPEYLSRFYFVLQQGLRFYHGDEVSLQTYLLFPSYNSSL